MSTTKLFHAVVLILAWTAALPAEVARRPLKLDDVARMREVRDPQCSPDGQWVAYVVAAIDVKEDKTNSHVWMVRFDGRDDRQMTSSQESETSPRWSPDGKYLSFTSSRRGKTKDNQVWLLDRNGGEEMQRTEVQERLQRNEWEQAPNRTATVNRGPDPDAEPPAEGGG